MMMSCNPVDGGVKPVDGGVKPVDGGVKPRAECERMDVNIPGEIWYLCKVGDMKCIHQGSSYSGGMSCFRDIYY